MPSDNREIEIMANLLDANISQAEINRAYFREHGCLAINILGSPGAGKTTLLERTLREISSDIKTAVIEGDLFTSKDADRIAAYKVPVKQINTGGGCHLDSKMIKTVLPEFDWEGLQLMIIENVGNLVCPAEFDLGEEYKIVILSIVEGDDKPAKYPVVFRNAQVVVINKIDLKDFTDASMENMKKDIRQINPDAKIFEVSCRTLEGVDSWVGWLRAETQKHNRRYKTEGE